jgi:hypothetical protein
MIYKDGTQSPAGDVFDEAIELGIEERSPYPERSTFLDTDMPGLEARMEEAADEGQSIVLVSPDHSAQVIAPEEILGRPPANPRPSLLGQLGDQRLDD